ncbi:undecaprenyl-phosphate glucose phosphotransferase [Botryobacter ruber]|uniref:undecaprenyl-phosphate glucose phosphotransferase n=1 Tax=Botryobacter ruber TaxID=2171629 RepID=UPI000E0B2A78|nr:undecaprenyl-phosphate glucose phosphotransferase [Botryobacter ruber]
MTYKYETCFKWINVVVDFILLDLILYAVYIIYDPNLMWAEIPATYRLKFLFMNLLWFFSSRVMGLYDNILTRDAYPTMQATAGTLAMFIVAPYVLALAVPEIQLPGDFFITSCIAFGVLLFCWKFSFLLIRKYRRRFWLNVKKVAIVGDGQTGTELYQYISENAHFGYQVECFFDNNLTEKAGEGMSFADNIAGFFNHIISKGITEIYSTLPKDEVEKIRGLMQEADNRLIRFKLVPDIDGFFNRNFVLDLYGYVPVLSHRNEPLENKANEIVKRIFDVAFSLSIIILILSWLVPIIGLIIKLDSRGPVFFKQLRSGKDNKPFYCLKFRSMSVNNDSDSKQATKGDARITKVGAFLRKTSLDELPQFINVLMGEMSVVGPRPHMLKHTKDYSVLIDSFMVRHFLTPGITGWAQVNGFRGETKETTAMSKRVEADLWYLENWTFLLDLKIIILTMWQSVKGHEKAF